MNHFRTNYHFKIRSNQCIKSYITIKKSLRNYSTRQKSPKNCPSDKAMYVPEPGVQTDLNDNVAKLDETALFDEAALDDPRDDDAVALVLNGQSQRFAVVAVHPHTVHLVQVQALLHQCHSHLSAVHLLYSRLRYILYIIRIFVT